MYYSTLPSVHAVRQVEFLMFAAVYENTYKLRNGSIDMIKLLVQSIQSYSLERTNKSRYSPQAVALPSRSASNYCNGHSDRLFHRCTTDMLVCVTCDTSSMSQQNELASARRALRMPQGRLPYG
uniref:Uncharacterized protein n=1 Tax=Peronospora matthiolae TaxID=2874970 RepID=A0AAV1V2B4_9STRA